MISKLHFHATNRCINYCKHCSVSSGPQGKCLMSKDDFEYVIDWASESGAKWLEISGGEPLTLEEDLFHMIEYAHDKGIYVSLLSNGCLIDKRKAEKLKSVGTTRVGISIYGARPDTHDDFTQTPGSYIKMIEGIRNVSRAGLEPVANVVVTPRNVDELHLLPSLLNEVDLYTFASIVPSGRGAELEKYYFSEKGYEKSIKTIENAFSGSTHYFITSLYPFPSKDLERYCPRPIEEITINHEGHIIPCCVLPVNLQCHVGDVRKRNFHDTVFHDSVFYWLKKGHRAMRDETNYPKVSRNLCKNCIEMLYLLKESKINYQRP